ncbi:MAG: conjugal transfer protein TraX [Defluviitaleaceae bacterium]|nr:conjugal transfer protein TraX [Defluviitaleaceae bacterium]
MMERLNLDAYKLKWFAIIAMVLNHMAIAWWDIIPSWLVFPLYAIGGLTFPIMAYFVVEGYKHTSNLKRYIFRILMVGIIAMPFHILALGVPLGGGNPALYPWLNIMFSIALSLIVLVIYDKIKFRILFWLIYIVVIIPVSFLFFEWYFIGITMVLLFYIIKNETARRIVPPVFTAVSWAVFGLLAGFMPTYEGMSGLIMNPDFMLVMPTFAIGSLLAAFLIKNYNGGRGKKMKWLFYMFYPLHLAVLLGVAIILGIADLSLIGL